MKALNGVQATSRVEVWPDNAMVERVEQRSDAQGCTGRSPRLPCVQGVTLKSVSSGALDMRLEARMLRYPWRGWLWLHGGQVWRAGCNVPRGGCLCLYLTDPISKSLSVVSLWWTFSSSRCHHGGAGQPLRGVQQARASQAWQETTMLQHADTCRVMSEVAARCTAKPG